MPSRNRLSPKNKRSSPSIGRVDEVMGKMLMIIDHERLQNATWAEFHTVRKRLDKATRDLHRHEEIDVPAFDAWLNQTFPLQLTALRELNEEVTAKALQIRAVKAGAARTGRSLKRLWHEQKEFAADPKAFREKFKAKRKAYFDDRETSADEHEAEPEDFRPGAAPNRSVGARDIYRRLVQLIHPDRGGDWSPKRQQLWHEVQRAWAAGDADWLARLEVEWETAHEVLGPRSPVSRLRAAIEELHAARRDVEQKLSEYRTAQAWRFMQTAANRAKLRRRVEAEFIRDFALLQRQLNYLNRTIAAWEEDWTQPSSRTRPRRSRFQRTF